MKVTFIVFLITINDLCAFNLSKWNHFKKKYQKQFVNTTEEFIQMSQFISKMKNIKEHNQRYQRGLEMYKVGINKFSDLKPKDIFSNKISQEPQSKPLFVVSRYNLPRKLKLPPNFDWRKHGVMSEVKDQGICGACWAFATTGTLEAHYKIMKKITLNLSEQHLIDCVKKARGCVGGWMDDAYSYIYKNNGIHLTQNYPYKNVNRTNICQNVHALKIPIRGYATLDEPNEKLLQKVLVYKGPVSVAFDATGSLASYVDGIYYNESCTNFTFSHAAVLIGYGTKNRKDYWILKNSWGKDWGQNGHFKIIRNHNNHCGIASKVSFPVF